MAIWILGSVVAVLMLVVVGVALWRGPAVRDRPQPRPGWGLPTPDQVEHGPFPLTLQGYAPDRVDAHLAAVADAYAALYERTDADTRRVLDERLRRARTALGEQDAAPGDGAAGDPSAVVIPKVRRAATPPDAPGGHAPTGPGAEGADDGVS